MRACCGAGTGRLGTTRGCAGASSGALTPSISDSPTSGRCLSEPSDTTTVMGEPVVARACGAGSCANTVPPGSPLARYERRTSKPARRDRASSKVKPTTLGTGIMIGATSMIGAKSRQAPNARANSRSMGGNSLHRRSCAKPAVPVTASIAITDSCRYRFGCIVVYPLSPKAISRPALRCGCRRQPAGRAQTADA